MAEATYSIKELVQVARKLFKHSGALVEAALQLSGKKSFTLDEAKLIIKEFAERPVE
ncbi:MAG: hypothetical protein II968_04650 [Selenomonadaceae bacterium]|nr:hypothetical protein [Selenomonadaceae bacterium]